MITLTPKRHLKYLSKQHASAQKHIRKRHRRNSKPAVTEGNRNLKLGDLFEIQEDTSKPLYHLTGDVSKVKRIGALMKTGEIVINGDVGMHTGEKMTGGKITVNGNIGGWSGNDMKGGLIEVHGNAGDYLASPYRGTSTGMKGGVITIDGNVGTDSAAI